MIVNRHYSEPRVLIAEDSKTMNLLLQKVCQSLNFIVDSALNGQLALDLMKNSSYDIYIVDLDMPIMGGIELIKHIKARQPDAIILVETATDNPDTIITVMRLGVFDYIIKPVELPVMEVILEKAKQYFNMSQFHQRFEKTLKEEIGVIRNIQSSMQPDLSVIESCDITVSMIPAIEISGDFYDAFPIREKIWDIILCDVAGHGIASAYLGSEFKSIFRYLAKQHIELDSTFYAMNSHICEKFSATAQFSTAVACQIDMYRKTITYASAGHPPGWLWKASTRSIEKLPSTGPLLGAFPGATFTTKTITMEQGDTVLFVTDGVPDMLNVMTRERFGYDRLDETVAINMGKSSQDIVLELLSECYNFSNHVGQADDMTIICMRRK